VIHVDPLRFRTPRPQKRPRRLLLRVEGVQDAGIGGPVWENAVGAGHIAKGLSKDDGVQRDRVPILSIEVAGNDCAARSTHGTAL